MKMRNDNLIKEEIIKSFDFATVRKAMEMMDWKWTRLGGVPTVDTLKKVAEELLDDCLSNDSLFYSISSGGLRATKSVDEEMGTGYELDFRLVRASCWDWISPDSPDFQGLEK